MGESAFWFWSLCGRSAMVGLASTSFHVLSQVDLIIAAGILGETSLHQL